MKNLATKLIISGIFIIVLSGLEKILIFMSYQGQNIHDSNTLKNLTPSIVWNVTQTTKIFGVCILILGIVFFMFQSRFIVDQFKAFRLKSALRNAEFEASNQFEQL